jgi:hypothetical protein
MVIVGRPSVTGTSFADLVTQLRDALSGIAGPAS